ncbi:unnamed protein product [Darwinula stevensoni]|uniref:Solute carrier family 12 member 2 n=1 Tax=Darwinula stevensoni TaxID=69355 RepID=A0A7R8X3A6_9CRUS|nr:unnamed protein product [Darwinula stevensoni]CAG0884776.1 unnamed protein product [Darwinula stevensoni]
MELTSAFGYLIYAGCFAATLSSAIATLEGAPRVLMALSKDKLYPGIGIFAKGQGENNSPVRGYILCFIVAIGWTLIGELNAIASLLVNFYMASYGMVNFSVFHASISRFPGWRPAFKYYNAWVSLLGTLLCAAVMFIIQWDLALITFAIIAALYLYVSYRKPDANWGSSTQAQTYNSALKHVSELNRTEEHVKTYRPQLLVLSGFPRDRHPLMDFAHSITKHSSLLIAGDVVKDSLKLSARMARTESARRWLQRNKIRSFYTLMNSDSFHEGVRALIQCSGVGKLRPNVVLMGFKRDWQTCDRHHLQEYFQIIHDAFENHMGVAILRVKGGLDYSSLVEEIGILDGAAALKSGPTGDSKIFNDPATEVTSAEPLAKRDSTGSVNDEHDTEEELTDGVLTGEEIEGSPGLGEKKKKKKKKAAAVEYRSPGGYPLAKDILHAMTQFQQKQKRGRIDVWWLYDDGGLTLLLPFILKTRSQWSGCKLRVFTLASVKGELEQEQRSMAALLSKFRINYSDVIVVPDVRKKAAKATSREFFNLLEPFKEKAGDESVTDEILRKLQERNNRQMRLRELLLQNSLDASLIVMTLPVAAKGTVTAPIYMAWLETLTKNLPPFLLIRGNQTSVLTFYS